MMSSSDSRLPEKMIANRLQPPEAQRLLIVLQLFDDGIYIHDSIVSSMILSSKLTRALVKYCNDRVGQVFTLSD